jgi:hypothetical protein
VWLIGVVKLAEQNDKKTKHLRSARQWLTRAEESFDKDREVRGELNLFLAQAELQHAQETSQSRGWLRKHPAVRHGLAVIAAVILASGAYGVYNQSNESASIQSAPSAIVSQPVLRPGPTEDNRISLQPSVVSPASTVVSRQAQEPAAQAAPLRRQSEEKRLEPVVVPTNEQRSPVSSEEMKTLIRAAGKSLRGQ